LHAEATGFLLNFSNQVIAAPSAGPGQSSQINGGATQHLGLEVAGSVGLGKALGVGALVEISGGYTFARAKFTNGQYKGNYLPYAPLHTGRATLDLAPRSGWPLFEMSWIHVGSQFNDQLNTVPEDPTGRIGELKAYDVFDAGVRYREKTTRLTFGIQAKN